MAKYFMGMLSHSLKRYILEIMQQKRLLRVNLTSLVIFSEKDHEAMSDQYLYETTSLIFCVTEDGSLGPVLLLQR